MSQEAPMVPDPGNGSSYVVALRASAGFYLGPDDPLVVLNFPSEVGTVDLTFQTLRGILPGFDQPVRLGLWIDARGAAPSLAEAVETFGNVARGLTALLAVAVNAPADEPTAELAFDGTPGRRERDYWHQQLPEPVLPRSSGRRLDPRLAAALVDAYARHPARDRFHRAVTQYHHALQNWAPGSEIPALAHLWVGMEAMTPIVLNRYLADEVLTREEAAARWEVEPKGLNPETRRRLLFRSDADAYRLAHEASDGYEHGFLALWDVRDRAVAALDRTARYLRSAIIDQANLHADIRAELEHSPLDRPSHPEVGLILRGTLLDYETDRATTDVSYPDIGWESTPIERASDEDGDAVVSWREGITAGLPEGASFRPATVVVEPSHLDEGPGATATSGSSGEEVRWERASWGKPDDAGRLRRQVVIAVGDHPGSADAEHDHAADERQADV